jgi:hypothetical protein
MTILQAFEFGLGLPLVKLGMVPLSYLFKYDLYKTYQECLIKYPKKEARKMVFIKSACGHWDLYRAIKCFENRNEVEIPQEFIDFVLHNSARNTAA